MRTWSLRHNIGRLVWVKILFWLLVHKIVRAAVGHLKN